VTCRPSDLVLRLFALLSSFTATKLARLRVTGGMYSVGGARGRSCRDPGRGLRSVRATDAFANVALPVSGADAVERARKAKVPAPFGGSLPPPDPVLPADAGAASCGALGSADNANCSALGGGAGSASCVALGGGAGNANCSATGAGAGINARAGAGATAGGGAGSANNEVEVVDWRRASFFTGDVPGSLFRLVPGSRFTATRFARYPDSFFAGLAPPLLASSTLPASL